MISCRADLFKRLKPLKPSDQELTGCKMLVEFERPNENDWIFKGATFFGANDQVIHRPWCKDMLRRFMEMLKDIDFTESADGTLMKASAKNVLDMPLSTYHTNNWSAAGEVHQIETIECRGFFHDFM